MPRIGGGSRGWAERCRSFSSSIDRRSPCGVHYQISRIRHIYYKRRGSVRGRVGISIRFPIVVVIIRSVVVRPWDCSGEEKSIRRGGGILSRYRRSELG